MAAKFSYMWWMEQFAASGNKISRARLRDLAEGAPIFIGDPATSGAFREAGSRTVGILGLRSDDGGMSFGVGGIATGYLTSQAIPPDAEEYNADFGETEGYNVLSFVNFAQGKLVICLKHFAPPGSTEFVYTGRKMVPSREWIDGGHPYPTGSLPMEDTFSVDLKPYGWEPQYSILKPRDIGGNVYGAPVGPVPTEPAPCREVRQRYTGEAARIAAIPAADWARQSPQISQAQAVSNVKIEANQVWESLGFCPGLLFTEVAGQRRVVETAPPAPTVPNLGVDNGSTVPHESPVSAFPETPQTQTTGNNVGVPSTPSQPPVAGNRPALSDRILIGTANVEVRADADAEGPRSTTGNPGAEDAAAASKFGDLSKVPAWVWVLLALSVLGAFAAGKES